MPETHTADDVGNKPIADAEERPESVVHNADDIDNKPAADAPTTEPKPVTVKADWVPTAADKPDTEDKTVKAPRKDK